MTLSIKKKNFTLEYLHEGIIDQDRKSYIRVKLIGPKNSATLIEQIVFDFHRVCIGMVKEKNSYIKETQINKIKHCFNADDFEKYYSIAEVIDALNELIQEINKS